jgi:hypothetical protein
MQDPEFEKKVRKKMEELNFSPSESVWPQVEKQIQADRRRRKPLLWIFFLSGLFLMGGSFFLMQHKTKSSSAVHKPDQIIESPEKKQASQVHRSSDSALSSTTGNAVIKEEELFSQPALIRQQRKPQITSKNKKPINQSSSGQRNKRATNRQADANLIADHELLSNSNKNPQSPPATGVLILPADVSKPESKAIAAPEKQKMDSVKTHSMQATTTSRIANKHPWVIGLSAVSGISNLKYDLPQFGYASQGLYYPVTALSNPGISGNTSTKTGFSFAGGVWLQKNLSNNVYLSLGLNYHYYSNIVTLTTTSSAYSALIKEESHTDQYHFIELPVGLGFRLSSNNKFPLFGEFGFALSQMLSTNAGQFDALSGNYTPDSLQFRKFQFMVYAALMVDISSRHHTIFIGPMIQYAPQSLISEGGGNAEHLFFTGLRFNYSLKK